MHCQAEFLREAIAINTRDTYPEPKTALKVKDVEDMVLSIAEKITY